MNNVIQHYIHHHTYQYITLCIHPPNILFLNLWVLLLGEPPACHHPFLDGIFHPNQPSSRVQQRQEILGLVLRIQLLHLRRRDRRDRRDPENALKNVGGCNKVPKKSSETLRNPMRILNE